MAIPTDHYVALDFQGFEQAIDLLGGVDLTVDKRMDYDDNWGHLHIHLRPGFQHLNGQQAMGFVRFRHSDSDLVRVQRQQNLLAALKAKLREPQTLAKLPQLLDLLDAHLASDLTTDQKIALAGFVHDTPREQIQMATLPSREAGASVTTDWPRAAPLIQQVFGVSAVKLADVASVRSRPPPPSSSASRSAWPNCRDAAPVSPPRPARRPSGGGRHASACVELAC